MSVVEIARWLTPRGRRFGRIGPSMDGAEDVVGAASVVVMS